MLKMGFKGLSIDEIISQKQSERRKRRKKEIPGQDVNVDFVIDMKRTQKFFDEQWKGNRVVGNKKNVVGVLPDGAWRGQRCFIIAGGPSISKFDLSRLTEENTIGCNRVYEFFTPSIMVAMDGGFQDEIHRGGYGEEARKKYLNFQGLKLWVDNSNKQIRDCYYIRAHQRFGLSKSFNEGLYHGNNIGFGALNLAYVLGANPIYLLGYDLKFDGKKTHFHDGHYYKGKRKVFSEGMMKSFFIGHEKAAPILKAEGVKVINLNPDSALRTYEFGKLPRLRRKKKPIIVSFYTKGSIYEENVVKLKESLWRYSLKCDIQRIDGRGNWHENIKIKPRFIRDMMLKHKGRPIVWVDADAVIKDKPDLFDSLKCDFAYHNRKKRQSRDDFELLSGTLYFANNERALDLVNLWIRYTKDYPNLWDQKSLQYAFGDWQSDPINKFAELPVEYCAIFDGWEVKQGGIIPVIEHHQLSRQVKYHGAKA